MCSLAYDFITAVLEEIKHITEYVFQYFPGQKEKEHSITMILMTYKIWPNFSLMILINLILIKISQIFSSFNAKKHAARISSNLTA